MGGALFRKRKAVAKKRAPPTPQLIQPPQEKHSRCVLIHFGNKHHHIAKTLQKCYKISTKQPENHLRGVGGLIRGFGPERLRLIMSYIPPLGTSIAYDFISSSIPLDFNFTSPGYTPPSPTNIGFNFTTPFIILDFHFGPEIPEPISKELLLSLGLRFSGQVYKYWVCYVSHGKQCIRRYVVPTPPTSPGFYAAQAKFRVGVKTWQDSSEDVKLYWRKIGARRKEPLPSFQTFLSCWMRDLVHPISLRHIRNLQIR